MSLINSNDLAKLMHLEKFGWFGNAIGALTLRLLGLSKLNKVYEKNKLLEGNEFFTSILKDLHVTYEIPDEDLKRIPKDGAFISISNHPLGGIDGLLLMKILTELRPDFKATGNFLVERVKPLKPFIIYVNPFENKKGLYTKMGGTQLSLTHLGQGGALGFFPAGEVATKKEGNIHIDKNWNKGVIKIIQKAKVPVVPIYFHAKNSNFFYFLSRISGSLRTLKLPSELFNKKNKTIKIRIGQPIKIVEQEAYTDINKLCQFLRQKTYMLSNGYGKKGNRLKSAKEKLPKRTPKQIAKPKKTSDLKIEIEKLRTTDSRLLSVKNYEVFFAKAKQIPTILHEIGRLREITFRAIEEGTNKALDIDKFDTYYKHLFLWDNQANKIAGAYRMGLGQDIYPKYGVKGFYVTTLFKFEPELHKMLSQTIEMGRAFVIKEYQQKPMPLFLLWKGVIHVTLRYPNNKYLLGGVSISNQFSNFSKSLMIEFMKSNYYDPFVAQYIHPKKEYKVKLKDADRDFIFDHTQADLRKFDRLINEIEPDGLRVPVLIKKYVKQNVKLVAFNVDPKFNNAIDGLMYIRIQDLPESTVKPVLEEYQAELLKKIENNNC